MLNHAVIHYQMYQYMHAGDEISGSLDNYQHLTPMKGFFIGLFHIESDRAYGDRSFVGSCITN